VMKARLFAGRQHENMAIDDESTHASRASHVKAEEVRQPVKY